MKGFRGREQLLPHAIHRRPVLLRPAFRADMSPSSAKMAPVAQRARANRLRTVLSCQAPPRAVRTPRSFNAAAMARNVVAPAACIWRTIGSTLAAKASARNVIETPLSWSSLII